MSDYLLPSDLRDCIVASLKVALEDLSSPDENDLYERLSSIISVLSEDLEVQDAYR